MKKFSLVLFTAVVTGQLFAANPVSIQCKHAAGYYGYFNLKTQLPNETVLFIAGSGLGLKPTKLLQDLDLIGKTEYAMQISMTLPKGSCETSSSDPLVSVCRAGRTRIGVVDDIHSGKEVEVDSIVITTRKVVSNQQNAVALSIQATKRDGCQILKAETGQPFPLTNMEASSCKTN